MTIEIHSARLEEIIQQLLREGHYSSVEEMLLQTLPAPVAPQSDRSERAQAAAASIRQLRKGVTLDRPAGTSLRDYAHTGHRH